MWNLVRANWGDFTMAGVASPSGALVSYSGAIALGSTTETISDTSLVGYIDNTFYQDVDYIFNGAVANFGSTGIRAMTIQPLHSSNQNFASSSQYQMVFSPPIPKTNLQTLTLRFRLGWNRAANSE